MDEIVFTPSAVLGLISEIEELKDADIAFEQVSSNEIKLTINNVDYTLDTSEAEEVVVEEDVAEAVAEADDAGYEDLEEYGDFNDEDEPIEGGIIKELAKTLLVGGLVRLTTKALK